MLSFQIFSTLFQYIGSAEIYLQQNLKRDIVLYVIIFLFGIRELDSVFVEYSDEEDVLSV
ncbi:MAG: hypothetical protein Ct9H300mP28_10580 [Pseudomonadota bacterium]|nr:MAG: hypothetical protein Ct9H300mP28_10580 [Pseudomonadota bacterium]